LEKVMRKKILGSLLILAALVAVAVPSRPADAQLVSNRCCDSLDIIRCVVSNGVFVLGTPCTCDGIPGVGHIC